MLGVNYKNSSLSCLICGSEVTKLSFWKSGHQTLSESYEVNITKRDSTWVKRPIGDVHIARPEFTNRDPSIRNYSWKNEDRPRFSF